MPSLNEIEAKADSPSRLLQRYMPALDVLRGLAILLVLLNHALVWDGHRSPGLLARVAQAGWLGVNLFFVLSGFLITGILLDSRAEEFYYRQFYLRRALRILPAYLLLVAVLLLLHRLSSGALVVALTFTTNDAFLFGVQKPYGLLWSLAVEEQFYLVWPAVVRRLAARGVAVLCGVLLVLDPVLRYLCAAGVLPPADIQRNALLIADNLACGALAAVFVRSRFGDVRSGFRVGMGVMTVALLAEVAGLPFGLAHRATPLGAALQQPPWNLFFAGLLLVMLSLRRVSFAGVWSAPLRLLGYVSYGLYLCHLLVFEAYDRLVAKVFPGTFGVVFGGGLARLILAGGLAVLVAWISRRFVENPFLRVRVGRHARKLLRQAR